MTPSTLHPGWLSQAPAPGAHLVRFRGDLLTITLDLDHPFAGEAWVRTTIGHGKTAKDEITQGVKDDQFHLGRAWFDILLPRIDSRKFEAVIPLTEVGHFEAKCFFLEKGQTRPVWPEGGNTSVNVEPAHTCCANIIYNTFVRQFGPNKSRHPVDTSIAPDLITGLDEEGYTVIPPSGRFRDLIADLDFIVNDLGCRYIQLLPIHPTPTTYARMGRFGSPYASLSFTAVDPALAVFDPKATPLEQFIELVDAVHARGAAVLLDIAINHTGWAADLHETHPEWLVRDEEGRIEAPGAWGIVWADLTRLDYSHEDLWQYMADIFLTWCHRGVDGFRCDAAYMVPVSAWEFIIASVRQQYPDTIFLMEGLGGKISVTRELLNRANFNWAYSELFQNYTREQIAAYLPGSFQISSGEGLMVHFAETHDNDRLAARSLTWAEMRTALCALTSSCGGFAFAGGVEWFATEKIDVHGAAALNWGNPENQTRRIGRLTTILKIHPVFHSGAELAVVTVSGANQVVLLRYHPRLGKRLLIIANLDDQHSATGSWPMPDTGMKAGPFTDLLSGRCVELNTGDDNRCRYPLGPGDVLCLSPDPADLQTIIAAESRVTVTPERATGQRLQAKALDVVTYYKDVWDMRGFDLAQALEDLSADPEAFCRHHNPLNDESRVVIWNWPQDRRREVMVPPGYFLLVLANRPLRGRIVSRGTVLGSEESLPCRENRHFCLFTPLPTPTNHRSLTLKLSVFTNGGADHVEAPLLYLTQGRHTVFQRSFTRRDLLRCPLLFLGTNGRGGMARANVAWGKLGSRYDALLASNLNPHFPEDRWIMFTRCRIWVVYQGFSQELSLKNLDAFALKDDQTGAWCYQVPTGQGEYVTLDVSLRMIRGENEVRIEIDRRPAGGKADVLADHLPVHLILRPDVEDRNFHDVTKAYTGAERAWPSAVQSKEDRFVFTPAPERQLTIQISSGRFVREPEWHYMVPRPLERSRGGDPDSDLFSPGYFSVDLAGDAAVILTARVVTDPALKEENVPDTEARRLHPESPIPSAGDGSMAQGLSRALDHFVVRRDAFKTVIAGYPWFLDWGRDTLIATRGLISDGRIEDAGGILKQFGCYEDGGTLPNMIHGSRLDNRDTSDAPLWFVIACRDLIDTEGHAGFLNASCAGRSIREVLVSIANGYVAGTANGIRMDPDSGLIYSPSHFTWMDTDHPAGTPRQGYPVEIQALWYGTTSFLAEIGDDESRQKWRRMAATVRKSLIDLYFLPEHGYLADCLHCLPGTKAALAEKDDALRPNQLLAITLGAVNDQSVGRKILEACQALLVPGGIRSLADQSLVRPLPVSHHGRLLNDPLHPYQGRYEGTEDTHRKPAYHNGTAWSWLFPSFCEAWGDVYGETGRGAALALLSSVARAINTGCLGQIPEIADGDYPHAQRGCDAQAWGVSEALRVWKKLSPESKSITE